MTTPTPPVDPGPFPLPSDPDLVRTPENFEAPIVPWGANVRTAVLALRQLLVAGGLLGLGGRLEQSYIKPVTGIPGSDLAAGVGTARGDVVYLWNGTAYELAGGQTDDGVSPQCFRGGPAGTAQASPLWDAERAGNYVQRLP